MRPHQPPARDFIAKNDPELLRRLGIPVGMTPGEREAFVRSATEVPAPDPYEGREAELQRIIATWIEAHSGVSPAPRVYIQRTDKAATMTPGYPDLTVCLPSGRVIFMEVKTRVGRLSADQKRVHEDMLRLNQAVFVVRSIEDAKAAVLACVENP